MTKLDVWGADWLKSPPLREREDCAKLGPLHSSIPTFEKQMKTEQRKENNNNINNNNNNNNNPSFRTARQWEMEPSASTMKHRWMAEHVKWTSKQTNEADEVEQVRGTRLVSHPHRRVEEARCEVTTKKQNKKMDARVKDWAMMERSGCFGFCSVFVLFFFFGVFVF